MGWEDEDAEEEQEDVRGRAEQPGRTRKGAADATKRVPKTTQRFMRKEEGD